MLGAECHYKKAAAIVHHAFIKKFGQELYPAETEEEYLTRLASYKPWDVFRDLVKQGCYIRPTTPPAPSGGTGWTVWASTIYAGLTEQEKEELHELVEARQQVVKKKLQELQEKLGVEEFECSKKAAGIESAIWQMAERWEKETGWIGTIMMTGLDENGQNVGVNQNGQNFEDILCQEGGFTPGRIRGTLFHFGQDIFDSAPSMRNEAVRTQQQVASATDLPTATAMGSCASSAMATSAVPAVLVPADPPMLPSVSPAMGVAAPPAVFTPANPPTQLPTSPAMASPANPPTQLLATLAQLLAAPLTNLPRGDITSSDSAPGAKCKRVASARLRDPNRFVFITLARYKD
ncbi:hypothetical protein WOLCODRAFT_148026 [Wolfiporia cocos MD-104 SS10]|uniref:Uncharacterized protein n=1 Tax=Wolfiporia cocos (strain MD-104) TaxID=742152 RepID=A0A2H3IVE2_WOLCO|nr:hypothetical protein WOLCODRAFT_148026 [Wolfiporia cocos MD-104 SS10]